jgi:integrase
LIEARSRLVASESETTGRALTPGTINRYVASISHVLTIARRNFGMLESSPAADLEGLPEPRGRVRYLNDDERTALLRACKRHSDTLHDLVLTAICTGARRGELLSLRWKNVHLDRGELEFLQTKNGEIRVAPLTGPALVALHERHAALGAGDRSEERVFIGPTKRRDNDRPWWVHDAFVDAVQRAGIKDLRFHDLRHEAASQLCMAGADLHTVATILGHSDLKVTQRYAHLTREHLHDAVAAMTEKIFGGTAPKKSGKVKRTRMKGRATT